MSKGQCSYCLDVSQTGPDAFCCGMQEDDYWRRRSITNFVRRDTANAPRKSTSDTLLAAPAQDKEHS